MLTSFKYTPIHPPPSVLSTLFIFTAGATRTVPNTQIPPPRAMHNLTFRKPQLHPNFSHHVQLLTYKPLSFKTVFLWSQTISSSVFSLVNRQTWATKTASCNQIFQKHMLQFPFFPLATSNSSIYCFHDIRRTLSYPPNLPGLQSASHTGSATSQTPSPRILTTSMPTFLEPVYAPHLPRDKL